MNTATRNKRDALAWPNPQDHNQDPTSFKAGFDAGYAIARKEAEGLVEALKIVEDRLLTWRPTDALIILQKAVKSYQEKDDL